MANFCKEHLPCGSNKCKFLSSALKSPFLNCHSCHRRRLSDSSSEEEETTMHDFEDMQEMIVSMIRSRAMESKIKRKRNMAKIYDTILHPTSGELFPESVQPEEIKEEKDEENDEFTSVKSYLSRCSFTSVDDMEAFQSVNTNFSCCPSLKDPNLAENKWSSEVLVLDSKELRRRAIIQEMGHCKGWPFGLCRKALLLPPLPKSPSESWSWCKGSPKVVKIY